MQLRCALAVHALARVRAADPDLPARKNEIL
jgi:hypothetical protein